MKKLVSTLLLSLLALSVLAQKDGKVIINNLSIKKVDNTVQVSFDAMIPKLASDYQLRLTPVLFNDSQSKSLLPIVVMGKKKADMNRRHNESVDEGNNWVAGKQKMVIPYKLSIAYEPWMNNLSLNVARTIQGCCEETPLSAFNLVSNQLIHYDIEPVVNIAIVKPKLSELQKFDQTAAFLYPAMDYDRRYEVFEQQREKGALIVYFQQGYSSIEPTYKNNRQTLAQVNKALDLIEADPNASLKKIVIVGLASPEGSLAKNDILAEKRASSLKYFVGERVKYDPNLFELINGSEDWDGLKKLVENSRMPDRWQVLEIIENYSVTGGREHHLMNLKGGRPYFYMMDHFFPQLRNAGYVQIYYESTPDVDAEKINSAIKLIANKQYDTALPLLLSVNGDKQLENMIGVCYMMTGDYAQATTCFEQAIAKGNGDTAEAASNLEQMRIVQSIK